MGNSVPRGFITKLTKKKKKAYLSPGVHTETFENAMAPSCARVATTAEGKSAACVETLVLELQHSLEHVPTEH